MAASSTDMSRLSSLGWTPPPLGEDGVRYVEDEGGRSISYPADGFEALGLEGCGGFWFEHRAAAVSRVLTELNVRSMWDVGSGTGAMAIRLAPHLREVYTVEPLREGARAAAKASLPAFCSTLEELNLPSDSLECVGAFDVIEHLEDASAFLAEVHRVLKPGGTVIITVPAFSWLWGDEDDVAGHFRRYSKASLKLQFDQADFRQLHSEYLFASLVPVAGILRALPYRLGRHRSREAVLLRVRSQLSATASVNRLAKAVLAGETLVSRALDFPVGLSLLGAFEAW